MINSHVQASLGVEKSIAKINNIVSQMPEGLPKYRLQAHIETMQRTAQKHTQQSLRIYDQLLDFAMKAAI